MRRSLVPTIAGKGEKRGPLTDPWINVCRNKRIQ